MLTQSARIYSFSKIPTKMVTLSIKKSKNLHRLICEYRIQSLFLESPINQFSLNSPLILQIGKTIPTTFNFFFDTSFLSAKKNYEETFSDFLVVHYLNGFSMVQFDSRSLNKFRTDLVNVQF